MEHSNRFLARSLPFILPLILSASVFAKDLIPLRNCVVPRSRVISIEGDHNENAVWTPDEKDIRKGLAAIEEYLTDVERPKTGDDVYIPEIIKQIREYKIQVVGELGRDGKKINFTFISKSSWDDDLSVYFGYRAGVKKRAENAPGHPVTIIDGGSEFWRITYDVEKDKCCEFSVNGTA